MKQNWFQVEITVVSEKGGRLTSASVVQPVLLLVCQSNNQASIARCDHLWVIPFLVVCGPVVEVHGGPVRVVARVEGTTVRLKLVREDEFPLLSSLHGLLKVRIFGCGRVDDVAGDDGHLPRRVCKGIAGKGWRVFAVCKRSGHGVAHEQRHKDDNEEHHAADIGRTANCQQRARQTRLLPTMDQIWVCRIVEEVVILCFVVVEGTRVVQLWISRYHSAPHVCHQDRGALAGTLVVRKVVVARRHTRRRGGKVGSQHVFLRYRGVTGIGMLCFKALCRVAEQACTRCRSSILPRVHRVHVLRACRRPTTAGWRGWLADHGTPRAVIGRVRRWWVPVFLRRPLFRRRGYRPG